MGFYGKVTNSSKAQFSFDRIYSNRIAMEANANKDSVFVNRYVLIEYDQIPFTDRPVPDAMPWDYHYQAYYVQNPEEDTAGLYEDSEGIIKYEPKNENPDKLEIVWVPASKNMVDKDIPDEDKKEKIFVITSITNSGYEFEEATANINYGINFNYDQKKYGASRGYDSTVWQKTYKDGKYKYVMVAELNSVVPSFTLSQDAPTLSPITPHFDKNSTNVLYNLHVQPQWGFRLKKATPPTLREINNITGKEMGEDLNRGQVVYDILPSDEAMTWSKEEYDKKLHEMHKYYYNENGEWQEYLDTIPVSDNLQSAIYYYKDGFNSDKITDPDNKIKEDYIRLEASGKSGHLYNNHKNNNNEIAEDIQELSIMLPSIGKAVANMWDIIYGGKEAYGVEDINIKGKIDYKTVHLTKEDFSRINKTDYAIWMGKWIDLQPYDSYNPKAIYGKKYKYIKRDKDIKWKDGTIPVEDIKLTGLRLINKNGDKFTYNEKEVETLAGSINSVHDLMGMIIVKEDSITKKPLEIKNGESEADSNKRGWAEYIQNSSDNRIYYTNFDSELKYSDDDDKNLKPHRYYRKKKDIDFIDITIKKNNNGDLILTDDGAVVLRLGTDENAVIINGVVRYIINKKSADKVVPEDVELGTIAGYKVVLKPSGEITRYDDKQTITKTGEIKLNSFTPITLEKYDKNKYYIHTGNGKLKKSIDSEVKEGKIYYTPAGYKDNPDNYWEDRKVNLLKWEPNKYYKKNDNIYSLDTSKTYDQQVKYNRDHLIPLGEIYFPKPYDGLDNNNNIIYYLQLIDNSTNKPYWFPVKTNGYFAKEGDNWIDQEVIMPFFNLNINDIVPLDIIGEPISSVNNIPGEGTFNKWLWALYKNNELSVNTLKEYSNKTWKFGGYFKMKLTEIGSGNTNTGGIIGPENQYEMYPYEQVKLIDPCQKLDNNKYHWFKINNYVPANFIDLSKEQGNLIPYFAYNKNIQSYYLYIKYNGKIQKAREFLFEYFKNELTKIKDEIPEGYISNLGEKDLNAAINKVIIKDTNDIQVAIIETEHNNGEYKIQFDDTSNNNSTQLDSWCSRLKSCLESHWLLNAYPYSYKSVSDYLTNKTQRWLSILDKPQYQLYLSIWDDNGFSLHGSNNNNLEDRYEKEYYYVKQYRYIQLTSEEEFNNFKSNHSLYTAVPNNTPLEDLSADNLPNILFYKASNNNEDKSANSYYILDNTGYIDPDKEYYTGEFVLVPEDNEFNETAAYYYLDYILSTEYNPNNLYYKVGDLSEITQGPQENNTTGHSLLTYEDWYDNNASSYNPNYNYAWTFFNEITDPFYVSSDKYYYYDDKKVEYIPTGENEYDHPREDFKHNYYHNVELSDFVAVSSDQFYLPSKYYEELTPGSGIYTLATSLTMNESTTYYTGENYYIISDDSGLYQPGAIWNLEIPVPSSVHLGIMKPDYIWKELPNFGKTLNTINGLILKMNQILEWGDKLTRDTSTAQGCINMLNDIIGKFGAMRPADLLITDSRGRVIGSDYSMIQKDKLTNYGKKLTDPDRVHEFTDTYSTTLGLNHIKDDDLVRDKNGRWLSLEVKNYSLLNKYYTKEDEIISSLENNKFVCSKVIKDRTDLGTIKDETVENAINNLYIYPEDIQEDNKKPSNSIGFYQFYYKVNDLLTEYDYYDYINKLQYKNSDAESSKYVGDLYYCANEDSGIKRVELPYFDPILNELDKQEYINRENQRHAHYEDLIKNIVLLKVNLTDYDWEKKKIDNIEELKHRLVSVNSIIEIKHNKLELPLTDEYQLNSQTQSNKNKAFNNIWEHEGQGNSQNGNTDTIELYAPIIDDMGHIVGRNTEIVTLPYGYKHIKTTGQSIEAAKDLFTDSYNNTDTSGASETKRPVANSSSHNSANNTQDILSINPGNKWIQLEANDIENSLTIAHEVHTVNRLTDSTDLNASADSYSNSKDKITVQDIEFDNAGHVVTNRKHTYTLPYSYKQFTTSQDTNDSPITQNTSTTTANNTQDKVTFKMGNKWLNSRVDNDLITFAHETHWTSDNDNVSYPGNNNTNRTDVKTTTNSNLNGVEDFTVESYKFDNAGHVISHNTHTYELPHNYSFIDLIGTTGSTNFIDGTGSSGSPTVLAALEAKARFSMYAGNRWITIKGTDTNGDKVNDSITFSHAAAGTAINTKGDSSNRVLDYGSTFNTIRTGIDEAGHVSVLEQYSVKLPTQSITGTGNVVTSAVHSQNNLAFTHAQLMDLTLSNSTTTTTVATAPAFNGSMQNHTSILSTDTLQAALGKVPNMIQDSIRDIINASDTSLDTLKEIADWISKDPNNTALNNYKSLVELEKDVYGLNGNALKAYNGTVSLQDRVSSLETSKNNLYSMLGNVDSYNPNTTYPDGTTKGTLENRVNWAETQINKYVTDDLKNKVDAAWDLLQTVQQTTGNIQNSTDGYMKYHMGPTAPTDADGNIITNAMWIDTTDPNNVLVKFPLISSVDSNGNPQGITWLAINTWQ